MATRRLLSTRQRKSDASSSVWHFKVNFRTHAMQSEWVLDIGNLCAFVRNCKLDLDQLLADCQRYDRVAVFVPVMRPVTGSCPRPRVYAVGFGSTRPKALRAL